MNANTETITKTVQRITELQDHAAQIDDELRALKAELATLLPVGTHAAAGVKVTVSNPSRRFNLDRALTMLTPEQRTLAVGPDLRKVKAYLPPVLLEQCMDPGTGAIVVKIGA